MKKNISLIICAVLIFLSVVVGFIDNEQVVVGAGNGKNAKITTSNQVIDLLSFISDNDYSSNTAHNSSSGLSLSLLSQNTGEEKEEYTSVTFGNSSNTYMSYETGYSNVRYSLERQLTVYMTKTNAYYESKGFLRQTITSENDTQRISYRFDANAYFDAEHVLFRFNELQVSGVSFAETELIVGKWIDFSSEGDGLLDVNMANYEILRRIKDYIDEKLDTNFTKKGNVYKLNDGMGDALSIFGINVDVDDEEYINFDFVINLSQKTRPTMDLILKSQPITSMENLVFYNINNTVVRPIDTDNVIKADELMGN